MPRARELTAARAARCARRAGMKTYPLKAPLGVSVWAFGGLGTGFCECECLAPSRDTLPETRSPKLSKQSHEWVRKCLIDQRILAADGIKALSQSASFELQERQVQGFWVSGFG